MTTRVTGALVGRRGRWPRRAAGHVLRSASLSSKESCFRELRAKSARGKLSLSARRLICFSRLFSRGSMKIEEGEEEREFFSPELSTRLDANNETKAK